MSMAYIRKYHTVPAKRGMIIKFRGTDVVIVGSNGAHLRVRYLTGSDMKHCFTIHPTWEVKYPYQEMKA